MIVPAMFPPLAGMINAPLSIALTSCFSGCVMFPSGPLFPMQPHKGVLAVTYYGSKGPELKDTWCRLRMLFESVRCFGDVENSAIKNYVLFASDADLKEVNLTTAATAWMAAQSKGAGGANSELDSVGEDLQRNHIFKRLLKMEFDLLLDRGRCAKRLGYYAVDKSKELWWIERWRRDAQRKHILAASHWVTMRRQIKDELWQHW